MQRRALLQLMSTFPLALSGSLGRAAWASTGPVPRNRVRPKDPGWPARTQWQSLAEQVGGRLTELEAPFAACATSAADPRCTAALATLRNTFTLGDQPGLTQTSGWLDAWISQPSAYAVAAAQTADVVAAVNFARTHRLRLVVKGGGHSYQGTSDAPDSLLVWTRHMNDVQLHDAFVPYGCGGSIAPQPAVTLGAGAMWIDAYDAVTTRGGRYVQGGGCTTVGVAGLVQSGGFGNFSKYYGTAAAGLLEAEVVTADGQVRIANAANHADLFWALKGGGGGSFGIVTRLTLRTRELPEEFGAVFFKVRAKSDAAFRALVGKLVAFYRAALFNPHWGEQIGLGTDNTLDVSMVFQGLNKEQAAQAWEPFLAVVRGDAAYAIENDFTCLSIPARHMWDGAYHRQHVPGFMVDDPRADAPAHHVLWKGDLDQAGWFIHGYQSAWLPAALLAPGDQDALAEALFRASRHWRVGLHFNKGLAGAPAAEISAARDTATNPAACDAFALAIIAGGEGPRFPGMPDAHVDAPAAREHARRIGLAMAELQRVAPGAGSYVSESDYFLANWQQAFWGENYARLARIK
ncbi:MAG TPA: FAD-binding protein, partial [Telluria sp.]|nr:FAD-binding protein [Telluria sp.]